MIRPVDSSEIKDIAAYEVERETWRPQMIAHKDRRRAHLGPHLTFLFEDHDTVRYQIQEMMRIERIVRPAGIRHELDTYNELIPAPGELSSTLLIEYASGEERDCALRRLLGLERHIHLRVGALLPVTARFDTRQISTDRLSAVQYVKFRLPEEHRRQWSRASGVALVCDHPHYQCEEPLPPALIDELAGDLR